mmetsp:Transcript_81462/g.209747  ORF Transcript_81462/g.209747 Transcript_81462/m.209747 type:complete len:375 (-) Transcript_81462:289-1413(-)
MAQDLLAGRPVHRQRSGHVPHELRQRLGELCRQVLQAALADQLPLVAVAWQRLRVSGELVANQAQGEDIRLGQLCKVSSEHLLGQVAAVALGDVVAAAAHGRGSEAQVSDLVAAVLALVPADEDVVRLDVEVHEVAAVQHLQAIRDVPHHGGGLRLAEARVGGLLLALLLHAVTQRALAELRLDVQAPILQPGREVADDVRAALSLHRDVGQGKDLAELCGPQAAHDLRGLLDRVQALVDTVLDAVDRGELAPADNCDAGELSLEPPLVLVTAVAVRAIGGWPSAHRGLPLRWRGCAPHAEDRRPRRGPRSRRRVVLRHRLGCHVLRARHDVTPRDARRQEARWRGRRPRPRGRHEQPLRRRDGPHLHLEALAL